MSEGLSHGALLMGLGALLLTGVAVAARRSQLDKKSAAASPGAGTTGLSLEKTAIAAPSVKRGGMTVIKKGSTGPLVVQWQTLLGEPTTGIFSANLDFMTREFQKSHGLVVDGQTGPGTKTWKAAGGA